MHRRVLTILAAAVFAAGLSACGSSSGDAVPVESVSYIMNTNAKTLRQVFMGVVSAGQEADIQKDSDRDVAKVNVKAGDTVKEGDVLFTYDAESTEDSLEQARLELEEQQNTLTEKQEEKERDEADMAKASASEQLDYTLAIQEVEADIREAQYQIAIKEKEIERLEEAVKNLDVTAPFDGVVESAGTADSSSGSSDSGEIDTYGTSSDDSSSAFIRIVETGNYHITGSVNEMNINQVQEGMVMTIFPRSESEETWTGTVTEVNTAGGAESQSSNTEYDYYDSFGSSDGSSAYKTTSTYSFNVQLDSLDGLMVGQHVYMTSSTDNTPVGEFVYLASSFINDIESEPWVWAERSGSLEKRSVTLGTYDEETDLYQITEGITKEDYIASPTDNLEEGMACSRNDGHSDSASGEAEADTEEYDDQSDDSEETDSLEDVDSGEAVIPAEVETEETEG